MKKLFLLAILFSGFAIASASAAGLYRSVVLKHNDSTFTRVSIEAGMSTTFSNGNLVLIGEKGELAWPVADISNWSFSSESGSPDVWAGINSPVSELVEIHWDGNELRVLNLDADSRVILTSLEGRVLADRTATGSCVFDGEILKTGVYILTVNNVSRKIAISR